MSVTKLFSINRRIDAVLCTLVYVSVLHETLASQPRLLAMDLDPILTHAESGDLDAVKAILADSDSVNKRLKLRDADKRTASTHQQHSWQS